MYGIINNGAWLKWIDSKTNKPVFSDNIKAGQVFFKRKKFKSAQQMCDSIGVGSVVELPEFLLLNDERHVEETSTSRHIIVSNIEPDEEVEDNKFDPEYLFKVLNEKCIKCVNKCKQSAKVDIVVCPQYKSK